ncbi:hypothetical protein A2U01_0108470, partial [Trifolium medium]|nr:hypothetical protein [Trifolium medium]
RALAKQPVLVVFAGRAWATSGEMFAGLRPTSPEGDFSLPYFCQFSPVFAG